MPIQASQQLNRGIVRVNFVEQLGEPQRLGHFRPRGQSERAHYVGCTNEVFRVRLRYAV